MVPACSDKVPRVSPYSGYRHADSVFAYGAFTLFGALSQSASANLAGSFPRSEPRRARATVCPPPLSLAATRGIDFSFFSSPYLDVSVQAVPLARLCVHLAMRRVSRRGFPHSDTSGSSPMCGFPEIFAAYRVLHRLLVPRHPPRALSRLTSSPGRSLAHWLVDPLRR